MCMLVRAESISVNVLFSTFFFFASLIPAILLSSPCDTSLSVVIYSINKFFISERRWRSRLSHVCHKPSRSDLLPGALISKMPLEKIYIARHGKKL